VAGSFEVAGHIVLLNRLKKQPIPNINRALFASIVSRWPNVSQAKHTQQLGSKR
jgi:hypothetical protein